MGKQRHCVAIDNQTITFRVQDPHDLDDQSRKVYLRLLLLSNAGVAAAPDACSEARVAYVLQRLERSNIKTTQHSSLLFFGKAFLFYANRKSSMLFLTPVYAVSFPIPLSAFV